jgi:hypothetical protein
VKTALGGLEDKGVSMFTPLKTMATGMLVIALASFAPAAGAVTFGSPGNQDLRSADTGSQDLRSADTRDAGTAVSSHKQNLRSADTNDAAAGRGTFSAPDVTVVRVSEPTQPSSGLDWGDAGIGAGSVLGLILLGLGGALAAVHRRQRPRSHPAPTG